MGGGISELKALDTLIRGGERESAFDSDGLHVVAFKLESPMGCLPSVDGRVSDRTG